MATKFLGASVSSAQTSIGWGTQQSQLTVTLVEDASDGDSFDPPLVGQPAYFTYGSLSFGGILQSWRQQYGESSNPIYEVVVVDPREILDGVQLITDGYTGDVSAIPNLYNIYKYWEDTGFGNSLVNDTGIPWTYIRDGFLTLQLTKNISFRGYNYIVDFSNMDAITANYRVGGENLSLLDFLDDVCNGAGCDYHVSLESSQVITIHTISRRITPVFGAIEAFVNSQTGTISKESGRELRNETNAKFLVGGQKEQFYLKYFVNESGVGYPNHNDIWPYWGTDLTGDVIMGSGMEWAGQDTHVMTLDVRPLKNSVIGDSYKTDTAELRAALAGEDVWQRLLISLDATIASIHYQKAGNLGLGLTLGTWEDFLEGKTKDQVLAVKASELAPMLLSTINNVVKDTSKIQDVRRLYEFLSNYASLYYGKKFMVRMPFANATSESDTGRLIMDYEPVGSAFVEENSWPTAIANHILPSGLHKFTDQNNKIYGYVRFNPSGTRDLSELHWDDFVEFEDYIFVKCEIDQNVVFTDYDNLTDPRAVITLPGRIKPSGIHGKLAYGRYEQLLDLLVNPDLPSPDELSVSDKRKLLGRAGRDAFYLSEVGKSYMPNMVALPVKSNIDTYGPWYALGADGKVEYEKDETLVPWNYGGYTQMNLVGNARVNTNISYEQANEGGVITVPGPPSRNAGDQLVVQSGYPYITSVNVTANRDGTTTTYHLQQWTPRFGTTSKQAIERFKKHSLLIQQAKKSTRRLGKPGQPQLKGDRGGPFGGWGFYPDPPERRRSSSSALVFGEVVPIPSSVGGYPYKSFTEVVVAPFHNVTGHLKYDYTRKGLASMDAIFRPFDISKSGYVDSELSGVFMPHFETPTGSTPTVDDLNPFIEPHDMNMFIQGSSVPANGLAIGHSGLAQNSEYRPMGLRAPLILVGWGYDTDGSAVPAGSGADGFADHHRRRQDLWKAGPLDARWSNDRKVWVASGGDTISIVRFLTAFNADPSGYYGFIKPGGSGRACLMTGADYTTSGNKVDLHDPLYNLCALSGELFSVISKNSRYEPAGEFGLFRSGTCHNDVNPGGSGSVSVTNDITTGYLWSWDNIIEPGQIISSGSKVHVDFDKTENRFNFTAASCSGSLP